MTPETDLATSLGIPLKTLRAWRKTGTLIEQEHWTRDGPLHLLTEAGIERIRELVQLGPDSDLEPDPEPTLPPITLRVGRNQGLNPRLLRCLLIEPIEGIGPRVSVRLITPRLATRHFRPGSEIEATPTDTPDIFEYHGPKPRTPRL